MAFNLGMTKEHWDASEKAKQAILRQPKMSQEEAILQARKMLGHEISESPKEKDGTFVN